MSAKPAVAVIIFLFIYNFRSFCGLPSEVPSFGSGIVVNVKSTDNLCEQKGEANTNTEI